MEKLEKNTKPFWTTTRKIKISIAILFYAYIILFHFELVVEIWQSLLIFMDPFVPITIVIFLILFLVDSFRISYRFFKPKLTQLEK